MTSFKRNINKETQQVSSCPVGFHPSLYNGAPITSTGIASLDDLLGGGLTVSSSFLIQEDHDGTYAKLILRYAMAQAIASNQHVIIVGSSFDDGSDPAKVIHRLMSLDESYDTSPSQDNSSTEPSAGHPPDNSEDEDEDDDQPSSTKSKAQRMKIAWRYESLQQHHAESANQCQQSRCHSFNLSKTMKLGPDQMSKINCIDVKDLENSPTGLIDKIRNIVQAKRNLSCSFRIVIQSIGSVGWPPIQDFEMFQFFKELQVFLRDGLSSKVAISSFPSTYRSPELCKMLPWATCGYMSLHSFAGDDRSQFAFPNHQGAVQFVKLPSPGSLSSPATKLSTIRALGGASEAGIDGNLGFKLGRRKGFRIEMMGLGLDIDNNNDDDDEVLEVKPESHFDLTSEVKINHKSLESKLVNKKKSLVLKPKVQVRFANNSPQDSPSKSLKNTDW